MRQPIYILVLLLFSATSSFGVYSAESPSPKNIRIIFGYENVGVWEREFTGVISQIFQDDARVIYRSDYLPLDAQNPISFALFSTLEELRAYEADAVIAVRPQASFFVNQWREAFFPGIPRVYVAPGGDILIGDLAIESDGLVRSPIDTAARETFELLPQLLPDLEHIYILSGDSPADAPYLLRIQNAVQEANLQQTIHYLNGLTSAEASAELIDAPQNSAAVFGINSEDRTGEIFSDDVAEALISAQIEIPLFGFFNNMLNNGIVGGSMASASLYATKAAELTLALLFDDAPPSSLEIPTVYFFDAIQLDRFGIDHELLPEGSELINYSPSFLQQYWKQLSLGGAIFIIQLFFILALGQSLRRRNKAEKEREDSRAALQEAQRIAHVGSWQMDLPSRHVTWSPELYLMQGLDPAFPPPAPTEHSKAFTPESWERLISSMTDAIELGIPYELELEMVKPDGKSGWMSSKGEAMRDVSGSITGVRGTAMDITERHAANEQLRRAQKMEAVGQLTGGIAHDFNNILAIIMGNLELVQHEASGDKKVLSGVDRAFKGATRGTVLINKLLGFSRVHPNETSPTSVNQLIENMDDLLTKSLTVSIKIETQLDAKLWTVNVDAGDLEGAILNMALNARDAMPDGGRLTIETANKLLDADFVSRQQEARLGEYVMLSVSDIGIGMLPEVREKVLEPFFTTKTEGKGTGLGLSMVYGFVKRSGGFITIDSERGVGTSINLFLPRERIVKKVEIPTIESEELPRGDETVLVVDDEKELTKLAVANLESLGYTVLTAFDGESALALIKDHPNIDLLFTDVIMPGKLDGYDLGITVMESHPALKILLTSGFTKRDEDDPGPDNPMIVELTGSLLRKPYNQAELAKAVRNALD